MTHTFIELTEDEFDARFPLLRNHLNPDASWSYGDGSGCLYETYGDELAFVREQPPATIWTLVDGLDYDQYLVSGYQIVNRIGYLISTTPVPPGVEIQVRISMYMEDDSATVEGDAQ